MISLLFFLVIMQIIAILTIIIIVKYEFFKVSDDEITILDKNMNIGDFIQLGCAFLICIMFTLVSLILGRNFNKIK